jgi:hypothetical protein
MNNRLTMFLSEISEIPISILDMTGVERVSPGSYLEVLVDEDWQNSKLYTDSSEQC